MFEADPGDEGGAEGEVEESLVGDCEDDEDRGEGEEDDNKAVEIVVVRLKTMQEWKRKRSDFEQVSKPQFLGGSEVELLKTSHPMT